MVNCHPKETWWSTMSSHIECNRICFIVSNVSISYTNYFVLLVCTLGNISITCCYGIGKNAMTAVICFSIRTIQTYNLHSRPFQWAWWMSPSLYILCKKWCTFAVSWYCKIITDSVVLWKIQKFDWLILETKWHSCLHNRALCSHLTTLQ